ncbi:hypothetical protein MPTK1_6g00990 [Marchantia polymorpha subsp. ruderalis]|nr:hypothetical protein MARPO_0052s0105 [Marchantia polymorpha]BBN13122.1 hypothetical protein Mp_6g00990 [Marchantia polymorpha subsp. ruderalis]|eukprot:PTQ38326.1 hypothetical protein MARPO_0052s0105 [Marchantia polymorpha]
MATGMELSILKLGSPRRRFASGQFAFDHELGHMSNTNSGTIAPLSAVAAGADEDTEMVFEQHQAAIPFVWEEKPGTPRGVRSIKEETGSGSEDSSEEDDDSSDAMTTSNPSSRNSSLRETDESPPTSEFEFTAGDALDASGDDDNNNSSSNNNNNKTADELFAKGQILPLKPPPRLQSIKQLMAADAAEEAMGFNSPKTPGHSFRKDGLRTPTRSFRKDGLKAFISSPRREKQGELVTTMLGFEEWPKDGDRKGGPGHRRTNSLTKLPALFRKKYGLGKENMDDYEGEHFDGDLSGRKSVLGENRRPLNCLSSRTLDGSYENDDFFASSRSFDVDARSDYLNASGRILEEQHEEEEDRDQEPQLQAPDTPGQRKQALGKLSRFFKNHKPSRLSAVAPTPLSPDELKIKRVQHTSPLLKMCLSNCIGQALVRGVKHFRSLDSQPRRALSAAR